MGFVIYDIETTGPDRPFDQIIKLAAIHASPDLEILGRFEACSRLQSHVVPSPSALLASACSIEEITDPALPSHYEMACSIDARMRQWTPAIFIGWRLLDSMDEMLRQALYQSLHDPYLTAGANGRADVHRIARVAHSEGLELDWPIDEEGKPSTSLATVARAAGHSGDCTSAMARAETTLHLARMLAEHAPGAWSRGLRFSRRKNTSDFISGQSTFMYTSIFYGTVYRFPLLDFADDPGRPGQRLAYDLRVDPSELHALDGDALIARLQVSPRPVRSIRLNDGPQLCDLDEYDPARTSELEMRAARVAADEALLARLVQLGASKPYEATPDAVLERRIHEDVSEAGRELRRAFCGMRSWEERAELVKRFPDQKLRQLGLRLLHHNAPHLLPADIRAKLAIKSAERVLGRHPAAPGQWRTLPQAHQEAQHLEAYCAAADRPRVAAIREYLERQIDEHTAYIAARCK